MKIDGIDEEQDPRMVAAQEELLWRFQNFFGQEFYRLPSSKANAIIHDHYVHWKLKGVDFPKMVALILPSIGKIELFRKDLEINGVANAIVAVIKREPKVDRAELANEVRRCWPDYAKRVDEDKKKLVK